MGLLIGGIADDSTGATDLANTLVKQGVRAAQLIGVPSDSTPVPDAEAVVVALKTRTAPKAEAVAQSVAALEWLLASGAEQIVFKYCSTFDSTAEGNIGPVADALLDALGDDLAVVCPAFPGAGRTIYQGHLFVFDQLLSDSPMKDHPLTPMRDASLLRLVRGQCRRKVGLVPQQTVAAGEAALREALERLRAGGAGYAVVDALDDGDLLCIGAAVADHRLVTGGSGIAMGLPGNFRKAGKLGAPVPPTLPKAKGPAIVLAGSCSQATRAQIAWAKERWPCFKLDPDRVAAGPGGAAEAIDWAAGRLGAEPLLVYGSADPEEVAAIQARYGRERAGAMMEEAIGRTAAALVEKGARRVVVAGGETSGAALAALGVTALRIGPEIAPGVPWTEALGDPPLALALKSGNFGGPDFFGEALEMLP